ncbi:hypothetical protein [Edwardsiella tarda]|uniref:hypothetical protein n=1 Tax=Edwardsiella tarda TaxID=636 RepID=UPI000D513E82|nr:hypothetical protein DCF76_16770 [Edwardsiella tarda]
MRNDIKKFFNEEFQKKLEDIIESLTNAPLGDRKETIMLTLHNALKNSKKKKVTMFFNNIIETLKQLREVRDNLKEKGEKTKNLEIIENAIFQLASAHKPGLDFFKHKINISAIKVVILIFGPFILLIGASMVSMFKLVLNSGH